MLFKNTKKLVFVEEKKIQPKDESKQPFSILKFADPISYDTVELFKSRNLVRELPPSGTECNIEISLSHNGRYLSVVAEDLLVIAK